MFMVMKEQVTQCISVAHCFLIVFGSVELYALYQTLDTQIILRC